MSENTRKVLSLKGTETEIKTKLSERLHKVLAQAGLGSRRLLEERIAQGAVKINGETAQTGQSVSSGDRIELDGKMFVASALTEPSSVLIYNKPEGEVTTREDPEGRPTIFDSLPRLKGARWIAVGRLDINTTGLLLLTTDGELANALMHPSSNIQREYVCRIHGEVPDAVVELLQRGVELEDGPAKFEKIERIGSSDSHAWFQVVISEGRNREVRRLWESQGFQVSRLKRVRYGDITLPRLLKRGQCSELEQSKVDHIRALFSLDQNDSVLTLQPVIGQRKTKPTEIHVGADRQQNSYITGQVNEEARELRRFDHVREERPRGRGRPGAPAGKRPFARDGAPRTARGPRPEGDRPYAPRGPRPEGNRGPRPEGDRPYAPRGPRPEGNRGPRPEGDRPYAPRGPRPEGNRGPRPDRNDDNFGNRAERPRADKGPRSPGSQPAGEFKSWYVPEGVNTGSRVAPPRGERPFNARGPRPEGDRPYAPRGPRPEGNRGPRPEGDRPYAPRGPRPDGNRGPRPEGDRPYAPRGPRPEGNRGPRPEGNRPYAPRGPRPEGNRGPRPEGDRPYAPRGPRPEGNRGPRPEGDRPYAPRGPRPEGNRGPRPQGDRPPFKRKRPDEE